MVSLPPCRPPPHCRTLCRRGHSPWALHPTPPKCRQSRTAGVEFAHPRAFHRIPRRNTIVHRARRYLHPTPPKCGQSRTAETEFAHPRAFHRIPRRNTTVHRARRYLHLTPPKCGQSRTAEIEFAHPRANCKTDGCLSAL